MSARERKAPPTADDLLPPEEEARLQFVLDAAYRRVLLEVHHLTRDALELTPADFRLDDAATRAILEHAAERVVGITEETRQSIAAKLAAGQEAGLSTQEIADSIAHLFTVTWKSRPETVAATEIAEAQRVSAIDRYKATGLVDNVRLTDAHRGTDHTETCLARNGTTVPLDEAPALDHPNCLVPNQLVFAPNVEAAFSRWFEGEVVVLRTAADDHLTVTPKHPILTGRGWLAAGNLREGDYVFRSGEGERITRLLDPNHDNGPTHIQNVAHTRWPARNGAPVTVPGSSIDFHGDGSYRNVNIVRADGPDRDGVSWEEFQQLTLDRTLMSQRALLTKRTACEVGIGTFYPAYCLVGLGGDPLAILGAGAGVTQRGGGTAIADRPSAPAPRGIQIGEIDPGLLRQVRAAFPSPIALIQDPIALIAALLFPFAPGAHGEIVAAEGEPQCLGVAAQDRRNLGKAVARLIEPTCIIEATRRPYRGHVYNLQTNQGWYLAENIITHNCSLVLIPLLRGGA